MDCAVIIPVGPGHETVYHAAASSAAQARAFAKGVFGMVHTGLMLDTEGLVGRSSARNKGVREASERGFDWLFFLDADDLMDPKAFESVGPWIEQGYDAVWGSIWTEKGERKGQAWPTNYEELLYAEPYRALQMGHFVKTSVALAHPFDESMDCGEDVDYYLRVWRAHKCVKIRDRLFVNRRGMSSTGPRAATGADWTISVARRVFAARKEMEKNGKRNVPRESIL